jgi:hypothetical protein
MSPDWPEICSCHGRPVPRSASVVFRSLYALTGIESMDVVLSLIVAEKAKKSRARAVGHLMHD